MTFYLEIHSKRICSQVMVIFKPFISWRIGLKMWEISIHLETNKFWGFYGHGKWCIFVELIFIKYLEIWPCANKHKCPWPIHNTLWVFWLIKKTTTIIFNYNYNYLITKITMLLQRQLWCHGFATIVNMTTNGVFWIAILLFLNLFNNMI